MPATPRNANTMLVQNEMDGHAGVGIAGAQGDMPTNK